MKERTLLVLEGLPEEHTKLVGPSYKIFAILDKNNSMFRGVGLSSLDCDIEDKHEILKYLAENYRNLTRFSMVVGYYTMSEIQYINMLYNDRIVYGSFERSGADYYSGREKTSQKGRLKRDLTRFTRHYKNPVMTDEMPDLYEVIEMILMLQKDNCGWKGRQYSIEMMVLESQIKQNMPIYQKRMR